jgi:hypothetical protein
MRLSAALCMVIALFGTNSWSQEKVQRLKKLGPLPQSEAPAQTDKDLAWFNGAEGRAWLRTPQGRAITKTFSNVEAEIREANLHIQELLTQQFKLNVEVMSLQENQARILDLQTQTATNQAPKQIDLGDVKYHLADWKSYCSQQFDRAAALGLADGKSVNAYQGAAAMNCTEYLKTIVQGLVEALTQR